MEELLATNLKIDEMQAIWFPPNYHKLIKMGAVRTGLPMYKYIMIMMTNKDIKENYIEERDLIDLQKYEAELLRLTNK